MKIGRLRPSKKKRKIEKANSKIAKSKIPWSHGERDMARFGSDKIPMKNSRPKLLKIPMEINDRPRWCEYEFPIDEAEIIFYSVFQ